MGVQRTTGRTVSHAAWSKGLSIVVVTRAQERVFGLAMQLL
jgi:hypothetical protein